MHWCFVNICISPLTNESVSLKIKVEVLLLWADCYVALVLLMLFAPLPFYSSWHGKTCATLSSSAGIAPSHCLLYVHGAPVVAPFDREWGRGRRAVRVSNFCWYIISQNEDLCRYLHQPFKVLYSFLLSLPLFLYSFRGCSKWYILIKHKYTNTVCKTPQKKYPLNPALRNVTFVSAYLTSPYVMLLL